MEDHIREAERIQHEIARQTAKAIWGTGLASAVISLLAVLLACWVAWEKRREKNEKKKKLEEEEKKKKKKTRADEEDEKRWNIAATQLQDIRKENADLHRAIDDAKANSKNFGRAKKKRIKRTSCTLGSDDRSASTRVVQVHNGHL